MEKQQHVHFIGICGTAMAPVAKMFRDMGWKVTGSDRGIYPPMSDYLAENKIPLTVGWHPELIGNPGLVVVGYAVTPSNPELQYVKERGLRTISYPQALGEYLVKKESIVVVGTAGKTSISGLLSWIFETAGRNPSYMSAGYQKNFPDGVRNTNSEWSIVEGDEPFASQEIRKSKFFFYKPKYAILTGAEWDHKDMFPTPEDYINNFVEFLKLLPSDGLIVANRDGENAEEIIRRFSRPQKVADDEPRVVWYGEEISQQPTANSQQNKDVIAKSRSDEAIFRSEFGVGVSESHNSSQPPLALRGGEIIEDRFADPRDDDLIYTYSSVKILEDGKVTFDIFKDGKLVSSFISNLIGKFNVENAAAAIAMALETGISIVDIAKGLETFLGIKRRMDVRFDDGKRKVIDDFAHNTMKFKSAIEALRLHYPNEKLVVIAEPNIGSRTKESLPMFKGVFRGVDVLIMPEFSVTTLPDIISAEDVYRMVKDDAQAFVIPEDEKLVTRAVEEVRDGGIICFMGSHGFRGMIEETVKMLEKK